MHKVEEKFVIDTAEYVEIELTKEAIYSGNLILVNSKHKFVNQSLALTTLSQIHFESYRKDDIFMNIEAHEKLIALIDACNARKKMVAVSGFRTEEEQKEIYADSIAENGIAFTRQYVARPMASEHQSGLAIDIGEKAESIDFIRPSCPDEGVCDEFKALAEQYGFVRRYDQDKTHITGISEEPWHFRYVGIPHAKLMNRLSYCLEEYIDFLSGFEMNHKHLIIDEKEQIVEIYFVNIGEAPIKLFIAKDKHYELSGNNKDGVIVTIVTPKEPLQDGI